MFRGKPRGEKIMIVALSIITILTVAFIFQNSCDSSQKTNMKSDAVTETVQPIVESITSSTKLLEHLSQYVRKFAHVLEFMLLGAQAYALCVMIFCRVFGMFAFVPLFGTLAVGVTDEFIQSFTGRTSKVSDILIDFSGAIVGMLLVVLITLIVKSLHCRHIRLKD